MVVLIARLVRPSLFALILSFIAYVPAVSANQCIETRGRRQCTRLTLYLAPCYAYKDWKKKDLKSELGWEYTDYTIDLLKSILTDQNTPYSYAASIARSDSFEAGFRSLIDRKCPDVLPYASRLVSEYLLLDSGKHGDQEKFTLEILTSDHLLRSHTRRANPGIEDKYGPLDDNALRDIRLGHCGYYLRFAKPESRTPAETRYCKQFMSSHGERWD